MEHLMIHLVDAQPLIDAELDAPGILLHDGQYKEVDHTEFILKDNPIQEGKEEEEVEEEEEEKESEEKSSRYQTSKKADE